MTRRSRAYAATLALLLTLTACASQDSPAPSAAPSAAASAAASAAGKPSATDSSSAPFFNPCRDLSARVVGRALGAEVTKTTGTPDTPRCAFLPVEEDGPTLNVTYLEFGGDFEDAWDSMGTLAGEVSDVHIAAADAARIVVNTRKKAVLVTGFVQVKGLIESINAVQLAPYDRAAVVGATRGVMRTLARHADG